MATTPDRITTPFGADATAAEVLAGVDLIGRTALVTGGASGIGVETARALAAAGAAVTITARDLDAGRKVADDIAATTDGPPIAVASLDLAVGSSVAAFVDAWTGPLHLLVANAGVMASPLIRTPEGWELQLATNHLGHHALITGLHRSLAEAGGARVVNVSSSGHLFSDIAFEDLMFDERPYDPWAAYGQSKTANVLFAVAAARRWADDGIVANALMPGAIHTALQRHVGEDELEAIRKRVGLDGMNTRWKTPEQGAATSVLLAASPTVDGVTGRYFEDCAEAVPNEPPMVRRGVAAYALDPERAARLWDVSEKLLADRG